MTTYWVILSAAGASFTLGSVLLKQISDTGAALASLFGERLGLPQIAGLGLAGLSIWLFAQSR